MVLRTPCPSRTGNTNGRRGPRVAWPHWNEHWTAATPSTQLTREREIRQLEHQLPMGRLRRPGYTTAMAAMCLEVDYRLRPCADREQQRWKNAVRLFACDAVLCNQAAAPRRYAGRHRKNWARSDTAGHQMHVVTSTLAASHSPEDFVTRRCLSALRLIQNWARHGPPTYRRSWATFLRSAAVLRCDNVCGCAALALSARLQSESADRRRVRKNCCP